VGLALDLEDYHPLVLYYTVGWGHFLSLLLIFYCIQLTLFYGKFIFLKPAVYFFYFKLIRILWE